MSDFYKSGIGTFDKELQALIDYGHDCCARIDDRIHECCERIREAHDVEVGSYQIALTWKKEQDSNAMDAGGSVSVGCSGDDAAAAGRVGNCAGNRLAEGVAPITTELREWAGVEVPYKYGHQLNAIADRIDAEHESACAEAYGNGVMSVPIALDESAWVELPKDADDVPIHVGDVMGRGDAHGRVIALMLSNYPKKWGGGLHWGVQLEGEQAPTALDAFFHHYHAPTVEDLIRDVILRCVGHSPEYWNEPIAEYAAKLRLAEDANA